MGRGGYTDDGEFPQDRHAREFRELSKKMDTVKRKKSGLGVVVGRFQVPFLHEGHRYVINQADKHDALLVFLGMHPALVTLTDPLDFPTREKMIKEAFPDAMVAPLRDQGSDEVWSQILDETIRVFYPTGDITLYCGQDGFRPHYRGHFPVVEVDNVTYDTGTDIRSDVGSKVLGSVEFRRGVIYASQRMRTRIHPCVDVAMIRRQLSFSSDGHEPGPPIQDYHSPLEVLLAQKPKMPGEWRFPGGFVSEDDESTEDTAKRELAEETGLYTSDGQVTRIGNYRVKDWRDTPSDRIFTDFYLASYYSGNAVPGDDLVGGKLQWFQTGRLKDLRFADNHRMLALELLKHLHNNRWGIKSEVVKEFEHAQSQLVDAIR